MATSVPAGGEAAVGGREAATAENKRIKVTVVGDSGVGKTTLLMTFVNKAYPGDNRDIPLLFENTKNTVKAGREGSFEVPMSLDTGETRVELGLTDTIGTDEYRRLRELFCVNTDMFLVCFSVTDADSLDNVRQKWLTEIRILTPGAPFILVGTKTDLREDSGTLARLREAEKAPLSMLQGIKLARSVGAKEYVECSSKAEVGVRRVFETVVVVLDQASDATKTSKRKSQNLCSVS